MKHFLRFLCWCYVFIFLGTQSAMANDVDALIDLLIKKNIISQTEAQKLLEESKKKEEAKSSKASKATVSKVSECAEKIKLKGSFKVRYEMKNADGRADQDRARILLRLGAETKVRNDVSVGFGITTGSTGATGARSRLQTLGDNFGSKNVALDYAYVKYSPCKNFNIQGGKFKNPLFNPTDLLWDTDITPEGVAAQLKSRPMENPIRIQTPAKRRIS